MFLKKIIFWLMLTREDLEAVACTVSLFETLCDLQGFAERAKQKTVIAV
jgi:hypothetical protein